MSKKVGSDIEIARQAKMKPIREVAGKLNIAEEHLIPYGHTKAKVSMDFVKSLKGKPDGKLILVTAINPTPAGEGKTTTTVGLGDGLNRIGKKTIICLREPSLGPCFGVKGGAAGGGYAQVVPMEDINLHFTGDFHAIGTAHNLLSALIDNHIYWGNELGFDARRIQWRRVMDMNDRALRAITNSLGGVANGFPREDGFDITVASEVMAIFCLATDIADLTKRLGNIIIGYTRDKKPIYARDLKADGPMTVLLKDAIAPNLVQTLENNPAFIHGGPFANIAHGCNSVIATTTALKLADYVVTEAGFGADLGAEKFFDIKCRKAGLKPAAVVIVGTIRALKMHGGRRQGRSRQGECRGGEEGGLEPRPPYPEREEVWRADCRRAEPLHCRHRCGDQGNPRALHRARCGRLRVQPLGRRRRRNRSAGQGRGRALRQAEQLRAALSGRYAALGQGEDHRH